LQDYQYTGSNFQILCFPSNNFGLQEPGTNDELLDGIRHVRPGNDYIPHSQMHFFQKSDVNGDQESALFKSVKVTLSLTNIKIKM